MLKQPGGGLPKITGGVSKKHTWGGGVDQIELLTNFEIIADLSAVGAAFALDTSYNTYKQWKGGHRRMTGPTLKLVFILIEISGTELGKAHGV